MTSEKNTVIKLLNGDVYTISVLANGLHIKKRSDNDEKISINTVKGDRIILDSTNLYIY
jgi:hypothetical protein